MLKKQSTPKFKKPRSSSLAVADLDKDESEQNLSKFIQKDKTGETDHCRTIVQSRGKGLSDLLSMKKEFEKHVNKVSWYHFESLIQAKPLNK